MIGILLDFLDVFVAVVPRDGILDEHHRYSGRGCRGGLANFRRRAEVQLDRSVRGEPGIWKRKTATCSSGISRDQRFRNNTTHMSAAREGGSCESSRNVHTRAALDAICKIRAFGGGRRSGCLPLQAMSSSGLVKLRV